MTTFSLDNQRQRLEEFITSASGQSTVIEEMTPLAGGASRDSWAMTVLMGGEPHKLVMRRDYPTSMDENALTRAQEYGLMDAAFRSGVKVAQMRWLCEDPAVLGLPFFVMDFVEGVSIGRKVIQEPALAEARASLPEQMAEQLAIIHQMQPDRFGVDYLRRPRDGYSPAQEAVSATYAVLDNLGAHIPAFEFALRWAERNAPTSSEVTFVHGDFRVGNLLVNHHGLAAVIDWEFGHYGDPLEEIGYLCMRDWRFGSDHLHAGGLCPRERLIVAYEGFSGRKVDRSAVDWWEIVGNIRWGVVCLAQAERHLSGRDPSVELASLGRRSAEMQLEALRLIEKVGI